MVFFLDDASDKILASSADGWTRGELECCFVVEDVHLRLLSSSFFGKEGCMAVKTL